MNASGVQAGEADPLMGLQVLTVFLGVVRTIFLLFSLPLSSPLAFCSFPIAVCIQFFVLSDALTSLPSCQSMLLALSMF